LRTDVGADGCLVDADDPTTVIVEGVTPSAAAEVDADADVGSSTETVPSPAASASAPTTPMRRELLTERPTLCTRLP
jgi:hypothetical protein